MSPLGIGRVTIGLTPRAMMSHADAWADLARRALEPSIFNDPAFCLPAALHLSPLRPPRFLVARDPANPSRMLGLCCLAPPIPGLPHAAWLHRQATAAFPLLDRERPLEALEALIAQTRGLLHPAGLMMQGLPADGPTMALVEATRPGAVAILAARSRAVVRSALPPMQGGRGKEFRRQARRLAEAGRVRLSLAEGEAVGPALETFLALETQGWKGRRGTALGQSAALGRFTRSMALALARENRIHIHAIELEGRPIAMGLVLRSGSAAFFWKTAFDERCARFSPGAHLADAIGRHLAAEPRVALTDSCAVPGHAMIDRLWPERMRVLDVFLGQGQSLSAAARLSLAMERMRRDLRRKAVERLAPYRSRKLNESIAP